MVTAMTLERNATAPGLAANSRLLAAHGGGAATYSGRRLQNGNGAQGRNRTTDTAIFNRMLYQLSYLGAKSSNLPA